MILTLISFVGARLYPGKCLLEDSGFRRPGIALRNLDADRFQGTWYEAQRDRFSYFSWGGQCNKYEFDLPEREAVGGAWDKEAILLDPGYEPKFDITSSQKLAGLDFAFTGVYACDTDGQCYIDYDKVGGLGTPARSDIGVIGTDYESWAVLYACKQHKLRMKNEWVWILTRSREPTQQVIEDARASLAEHYPKFRFKRLVSVSQEGC